MATQFHEDFHRSDEVPRSSERSFGLTFAAVFALIGLLPLLNNHSVRWWAVMVAAAFAGLGLLAPRALARLNRLWMAIGHLLNRIVSPIVMGLLFVVAVVPTGLWLRLTGKDPLRLKRDPVTRTYWLPRMPPGPAADSFKNQF